MYSLVLMAALTTGGEAPNFFFNKWGGHGCSGYSSCHGGWASCGGWSGCNGCNGCSSWGSCHGWGGWGLRSRWGGHGCWSSCSSSYSCGGYYSCSGGCWGASYGCGGLGCGGIGYGCAAPVMSVPMAPATPAAPAMEKAPAPMKGAQLSAPAKLVFDLPENAKLFVDELPIRNVTASRAFSTPVLQPGQTYYYVLRAEVVRDGKTHQETKRVLVRSGETIHATFGELERSLAAKAAPPPAVTETEEE